MKNSENIVLTALISIPIMLTFFGCGSSDADKSDERSTRQSDADDSGDGDASNEEHIIGKDTRDPIAAASLWVNDLKPSLEKNCATCHDEPRFVTAKRGPLTIFSYDTVKKMLADGVSSTDNRMIRKPLGGDEHSGGVRCTIGEEPCNLIVELRKLEVGRDDPNVVPGEDSFELPVDADPRSVDVTAVSTGGLVVGWAVNKGDLSASLIIKLVLDDPIGTGTLAATTTADKLVPDGNHPGDHGFFVQIPGTFRTGVDRDLYLYDEADNLLTPTPFKFKAYAPTAAGHDFFTATVAPKIVSTCNGCHEPNYEIFYGAMAAMGPNEGGKADDNNAVNKPGGVAPHSGGNRCGGIDGSPCKEIQQWWALEFAR